MLRKEEKECRRQMAACYRFAARFGMTDLVSTHISTALSGAHDILNKHYCLLFQGNLLRIAVDGLLLISPPYHHPLRYGLTKLPLHFHDIF